MMRGFSKRASRNQKIDVISAEHIANTLYPRPTPTCRIRLAHHVRDVGVVPTRRENHLAGTSPAEAWSAKRRRAFLLTIHFEVEFYEGYVGRYPMLSNEAFGSKRRRAFFLTIHFRSEVFVRATSGLFNVVIIHPLDILNRPVLPRQLTMNLIVTNPDSSPSLEMFSLYLKCSLILIFSPLY